MWYLGHNTDLNRCGKVKNATANSWFHLLIGTQISENIISSIVKHLCYLKQFRVITVPSSKGPKLPEPSVIVRVLVGVYVFVRVRVRFYFMYMCMYRYMYSVLTYEHGRGQKH
jgi:hypothetical protein